MVIYLLLAESAKKQKKEKVELTSTFLDGNASQDDPIMQFTADASVTAKDRDKLSSITICKVLENIYKVIIVFTCCILFNFLFFSELLPQVTKFSLFLQQNLIITVGLALLQR